jgi:hypothetical protein
MPRTRIPADPAASQDRWEQKLKEKNPQFLGRINQFLQPHRLPDGRLKHDDSILLDLERKLKEWKKAASTLPNSRRSDR